MLLIAALGLLARVCHRHLRIRQRPAGVRLQHAGPGAFPLERLSSLGEGKHTIVFDFKYDGPGVGKGGTGVLTVDGKEVDRKSMEHTIPFLMSDDESFDVGLDTRTPVDFTYDCPFRFTGSIDKLTFNLGKSQLSAEDQKKMDDAMARVNN